MKTTTEMIKTITKSGNAYPTSRCMPAHHQGYQEWADSGTTADGVDVTVYYIFDPDESSVDLSEDLPWDDDHIDRIEDADGNVVAR